MQGAAMGRIEPILTDAAQRTNGEYDKIGKQSTLLVLATHCFWLMLVENAGNRVRLSH
jgi:hypothetical protein